MSLSFLPPPNWEFSTPQSCSSGTRFQGVWMFSIPTGPAVGGGEFLTQNRVTRDWLEETLSWGNRLHVAKSVTLLIEETFSEMLWSVIRSVDSWWHRKWLASHFMHSKQKSPQMWMSALRIHCFWNKAPRNLGSWGCSLETILCFFLYSQYFCNTTSLLTPDEWAFYTSSNSLTPAWCHII